MATNERVDYARGDIDPGQQSVAQANRTNFTPGKATGLAGDMNWPKDHRIPTGTPAFSGEAAGPVEMSRSRVVKLGRNVVSDQVLQGNGSFPHTGTPKTTTITDAARWGADTPSHVLTPGTEKADAVFERRTGSDRVVGA